MYCSPPPLVHAVPPPNLPFSLILSSPLSVLPTLSSFFCQIFPQFLFAVSDLLFSHLLYLISIPVPLPTRYFVSASIPLPALFLHALHFSLTLLTFLLHTPFCLLPIGSSLLSSCFLSFSLHHRPHRALGRQMSHPCEYFHICILPNCENDVGELELFFNLFFSRTPIPHEINAVKFDSCDQQGRMENCSPASQIWPPPS